MTAYLPTIVTSPAEAYPTLLAAAARAQHVPGRGPASGVHLEGPFLDKRRRGAHPAAHLRPPDSEWLAALAASGLVRLVTLAPELPGSLPAIRTPIEVGVRVAIGHTDATFAEASVAVEAGVRLGTHLFNTMRPLHQREPGAIGALLSDDRVRVGLITDGVHVHPSLLKLTFRTKERRGSCWCPTRWAPPACRRSVPSGRAGSQDRRRVRPTRRRHSGWQRADARSFGEEHGALGGSNPPGGSADGNAQSGAGVGDRERARRIEPGCRADLVVLDRDLRVRATILGGRLARGIWSATKEATVEVGSALERDPVNSPRCWLRCWRMMRSLPGGGPGGTRPRDSVRRHRRSGQLGQRGRRGRYLLEAYSGVVVSLAAPSLFTLYHRPPDLTASLVVGVSQSGEAADVLEVLRQGKRQGALTVAITNHEGSPLAQAADHTLLCHAGVEKSVPGDQDRHLYPGRLRPAGGTAGGGRRRAAGRPRGLPEACAGALALTEPIRALAERLGRAERWTVLGRGFHLATALETALKVQEMSGAVAQAYSVADFLHGPVGVVDPRFHSLFFGGEGPTAPLVSQTLAAVRERGGRAILLGDGPGEKTPDVTLPVALPETLRPVPAVVAGQIFAFFLAIAAGWTRRGRAGCANHDHPLTVCRRETIATGRRAFGQGRGHFP